MFTTSEKGPKMNMQQRRYMVKVRIGPMQERITAAVRYNCYSFTPYLSWGQFVRMIKCDELVLEKGQWHKAVTNSTLISVYDNPFGKKGQEILPKRGGVEQDAEKREKETAYWKQRFTHAIDFAMLADGDTAVALLQALEEEVEAFILKSRDAERNAKKQRVKYIEWLASEDKPHDYKG